MEITTQMIVTIICATITSSGFWAFLQKQHDRNDVKSEMLIGLAHDRIVFLGMQYLERGYITQDEYENLYEYLYIPYHKLGGNGSAEHIMNKVQQLPMYKDHKSAKESGFEN